MKIHLKTLVMLMICMAIVLCVSCKKSNNEPTNGDIGAPGGSEGTIDGHEYIDLNLPSGTLWATCNVGADSPEDYGDYFAWGETTTKELYDWSTYKWHNDSSRKLIKYNTHSEYGFVDDKIVLDPEDDAAHTIWGGAWRMPTYDELQELKDNCTWEKTTQNGVKGQKVTGLNGKSIFLPSAGSYDDGSLDYPGSLGIYWSSSLFSDFPKNAYYLYFGSRIVNMQTDRRDFGHSIRPVCSQKK